MAHEVVENLLPNRWMSLDAHERGLNALVRASIDVEVVRRHDLHAAVEKLPASERKLLPDVV